MIPEGIDELGRRRVLASDRQAASYHVLRGQADDAPRQRVDPPGFQHLLDYLLAVVVQAVALAGVQRTGTEGKGGVAFGVQGRPHLAANFRIQQAAGQAGKEGICGHITVLKGVFTGQAGYAGGSR